MDFMNQIGGLLQKYAGMQAAQAPDTAQDDFDQLTNSVPRSTLTEGIAEAFRSNQTPPFEQMLGQIFGNSGGQQRASIINTLIATLGPQLVAQFLNRGGASGLAGLLNSGQNHLTPEQAEQIPAETVQEIATIAEKKDPSVIDRISDFYAEHPTLVKTLGAAALTVALSKIAEKGVVKPWGA
jgi:hypothetical protein